MSERALRAARERGFVLVGAVMIVLALTILGLSLFSLSSFESQFLRRSVDQENAFYAATGAMERVEFNLARSGRLEHSWFGFPDGVVDSARAWQWKSGVMVENGPIDPGIVHVRVHARVGDASQTVSGRFLLDVTSSTYRRLVTTSGAVTVLDPEDLVHLEGKIYVRSSDDDWEERVKWVNQATEDSVQHGCAWIQEPNVQPMFDAHLPAPLPQLVISGSIPGATPQWHFDAEGQQPGYFGPPLDTLSFKFPFAFSFSYLGDSSLTTPFTVKIRGPAVWLLPQGFYAFGEVTVDTLGGGEDAALVIIAGPNAHPGDYDWSIRFENGIHNPTGIPIVLVTNRRLDLWGNNVAERSLDYLSAYAGNIRLRAKTGRKYFLHHPMNSSHDGPGNLIDRLTSWGALPNAGSTVSSQLQLISGSWQESKN